MGDAPFDRGTASRAVRETRARGFQVVETFPRIHISGTRWRKPFARPIHIYEGERIVFAELRSVLKLVQAGKLKVTDKGGRPTENAVQLISEVLVVPDFQVDEPPEETTIRNEEEPSALTPGECWCSSANGQKPKEAGWR